MMLTEVTAPTQTVVSVQDFSDHLRLGSGFADDGNQDAALEMYLRVAASAVEARIGKALITRRMRLVLTGWQGVERQALPMAPIQMIDSVSVVDAGGSSVAMGAGRWVLRRDMHRPELVANGGYLPTIPANGQVEIVFEAGFGPDPVDVPADLRQAVLLLAAHYYEARTGSEADGVPMAVMALLAPHRVVRL